MTDRTEPRVAVTKPSLPPLNNDGQDPSNPPAMPFWEMKNVNNSDANIDLQWLQGFAQRVVSGDVPPIWMRKFPGKVRALWFNVLPVGWVGDWHPSPSLQWVVPLSGRWFIETQDGTRVEMGPGDIHWGADLSDSHDGVSGHRSGQVGNVPCVHLMLQFEDAGLNLSPQLSAG